MDTTFAVALAQLNDAIEKMDSVLVGKALHQIGCMADLEWGAAKKQSGGDGSEGTPNGKYNGVAVAGV